MLPTLMDVFCLVAPWVDDIEHARDLTHAVMQEVRESRSGAAENLAQAATRRIARRRLRAYLSAHTPEMHGFHLYLLELEEGLEATRRLQALLPFPDAEGDGVYWFLRRAFTSLDRRQRAALWLHHVEGLSYQEVGAAVGCTAKAVDVLIFKSVRKIRLSAT